MTNKATDAPVQDNLLGVCAALGEDFGVNPLYPRVALSLLLLWSAETALAIYAAMAVMVLATRIAFPNVRTRPPEVAATLPVAEQPEPFRLAA